MTQAKTILEVLINKLEILLSSNFAFFFCYIEIQNEAHSFSVILRNPLKHVFDNTFASMTEGNSICIDKQTQCIILVIFCFNSILKILSNLHIVVYMSKVYWLKSHFIRSTYSASD